VDDEEVNDFFATFVLFFAVIDPIGTVPVFIAVTSRYEASVQRKIAVKASLVAAMILVFFVVAGEVILTAIGTPLSAFQIAGGIVLFLFALSMIFGEGKPEEEMRMAESGSETAVFPLAVPSIASPGAMLAAVLQTENDRFNLWEQAETTAIMLLVLLIVLVLMLTATRVHRIIGNSGASIVSRVMGLILASVAVASVLAGIKDYFGL
jgi:multiple antibiotic resistance protein